MAKAPELKNTASTVTIDGKITPSMEGLQVNVRKSDSHGLGNQAPVSALPKTFESPKAPQIPKKNKQ